MRIKLCNPRACHQSGKPHDRRGQVNNSQDGAGRLFVARGDGTVLLELGKVVLDQMAGLVKMTVVVPRHSARGDDRKRASNHALAPVAEL